MSAKHQKFSFKVPRGLSDETRARIAQAVIDEIKTRTVDRNIDRNGKKFAEYSKAYINSAAFKEAKKSGSDINLTLSGDMLEAMQELDSKDGRITVGFEDGSDENGKADGNVRGTYGKKKGDPAKARDFMGLPDTVLKKVISGNKEEEETE